jgi:hypothetical protein
MKKEKDILAVIASDKWMMEILHLVKQLELPDWWIGAGFVRNKIWDVLHGYNQRTALNDVDVIYFDPANIDQKIQDAHWQKLVDARPEINWSVKNQAAMHLYNGDAPYASSTDALSKWVETPTCIGVSLDKQDQLILTAPHGIEDLINLRVTMNPDYTRDPERYKERVQKKNWQTLWPKLKIII